MFRWNYLIGLVFANDGTKRYTLLRFNEFLNLFTVYTNDSFRMNKHSKNDNISVFVSLEIKGDKEKRGKISESVPLRLNAYIKWPVVDHINKCIVFACLLVWLLKLIHIQHEYATHLRRWINYYNKTFIIPYLHAIMYW